jgi:hypothetical protein
VHLFGDPADERCIAGGPGDFQRFRQGAAGMVWPVRLAVAHGQAQEPFGIAGVVPSAEKKWQFPQTGSFSGTIGGGPAEEIAPKRQRICDGSLTASGFNNPDA